MIWLANVHSILLVSLSPFSLFYFSTKLKVACARATAQCTCYCASCDGDVNKTNLEGREGVYCRDFMLRTWRVKMEQRYWQNLQLVATPPKTEQEEGDTFGEGSDINFGNTNSGRDGQ